MPVKSKISESEAEQYKAKAIKEGLKVAKLMCVSSDNNNKYYDMFQISSAEFIVIRGRVDVTNIPEGPYSMSEWDSTYKDKTRESKKPKPYTDVTHLFAEAKKASTGSGKTSSGDVSFSKGRSSHVVDFVKLLQAYANKSVKENYTVSAKNVTKKQIDEAQSILNSISGMIKIGASTKEINNKLLDLYQVIPRRMAHVQDHLLSGTTIRDKKEEQEANNITANEQATLDVMAGQVALESAGDDSTDTAIDNDILKSMGLDLQDVTAEEEKEIRKLLGPNASQYHRAYRATNHTSEKKFETFLRSAKNKKVARLWHGSRNENWWSIFQQSLKIRPSNAVITGAMFGYGIYFADKAQKSIGYSSYSGSYFAKGTSSKAILAVYDVHLGEQYDVFEKTSYYNHREPLNRLDVTKMSKLGKDSVFAKGGADLRNNEYIVYKEEQCTIRYIVEIK
jgi:poly [ADP-ribose] polymerase